MKLNKMCAALGAALVMAAPAAAQAAEKSPHSVTGNFTVASEYLFRGIAQTRGEPAVQGGFDYAHASGVYLGMWGSNVTWISDATSGASAGVEVDLYGGYKGSIADGLGYDIGAIAYRYPGTGKPSGAAGPDTTEAYAGVTWKSFTLKYSRTTGSLFGWTKTADASARTSGSGYLELNASFDLGDGLGVTGHIGHQSVSGRNSANYSDAKVGLTKELGFGTLGIAYSDTNAKANCDAVEDYCFVNTAGKTYDAGKSRIVVTFGKTF